MDKAMPRSANRGFSGVDFLKSCRIPQESRRESPWRCPGIYNDVYATGIDLSCPAVS
jgi:hypothetical protein